MHFGSYPLWGCSALPAILPRSHKLYQNGGFNRETDKRRMGGGRQSCCFWWQITWWKGSVNVVLWWCRSQFFCRQSSGWSLLTFSLSLNKRYNSVWNWLFGLQGLILFEQSPWCQRIWWECSWFYSSPVSLFSVSVSLAFPCTAHAFFIECLSNHCQGLCRTFAEFAQNLMHTRCRIHCEIAPDQIHDSKQNDLNYRHHLAAWNLIHWLTRFAGTIIYSYIALLQLLYRWQYILYKLPS
jgi:hypothetical protein